MIVGKRASLVLLIEAELVLLSGVFLPNQNYQYLMFALTGMLVLRMYILMPRITSGIRYLPRLSISPRLHAGNIKFISKWTFLVIGISTLLMWCFGKIPNLDSHDLIFYPISSFIQQCVLFLVIWPISRGLFENILTARILTVALAAVLHVPNITLMLLVVLQLWIFSYLYERAQSYWEIIPLSLSHYLLGQVVSQVFPDWLIADNKVGIWYILLKQGNFS